MPKHQVDGRIHRYLMPLFLERAIAFNGPDFRGGAAALKKSEWERRIPLDKRGVCLLGAALCLRERHWFRDARRTHQECLAAEQAGDRLALFEFVWGSEHYAEIEKKCAYEARKLLHYLRLLAPQTATFKEAARLRVMDFRFRWDHLKEHRILAGFMTKDVPEFALPWDRHTPISKRESDNLTKALKDIFIGEIERVTGPDPDFVPYLQEHEDFLFYLLCWKLCETEQGRGHPKKRRWQDGRKRPTSLLCRA